MTPTSLLFPCVFAALAAAQVPQALDNGIVQVRYDAARNSFTASRSGKAFLTGGRLEGVSGSPRAIRVNSALGAARGFELRRADGGTARILLYPGVPFVAVETSPRSAGSQTLFRFHADTGLAEKQLRAFGTDGLTAMDRPKVSYAFLAIADPVSRAGIVSGWLTNDHASGIVRSSGADVEAVAEFGGAVLPAGQAIEGDAFAVGYFENAFDGLEAWADAAARANRVKLLPLPRGGYSTWYHDRALDEKRMASLADFAYGELMPFGFQVLQIDDEWQISRRDFTTYNPTGPYPSGMKATANKIRSDGMIPGLWLTPFAWDPARPVFAGHPDWFIHRANGELYSDKWAGTFLDMTHPDARRFLSEAIRRITREWGYSLIKTDGMWSGLAAKGLYPEPDYHPDELGDAVLHDRSKTNLEAYRSGLRLVREAAGESTFLLGCNIAQNMRSMAGSFGLVDSMRIGPDVGTKWNGILAGARMGTRLYFLHRRVWYNDPDCLILRSQTLSLDEARAWGSWIAISGQLNLSGDDLQGLPAERLDIFKRTLPSHELKPRPMDLFEKTFPQLWQLTGGTGSTRRDVIAWFNWDDKTPDDLVTPLARLALPENASGEFVGFDYWANQMVGPIRGEIRTHLAPGACRILSLQPALDRPQVIGTSRHVTQGIVDLSREEWNGAKRTLSATSAVVGRDPYEIRIHLPQGWKAPVKVAGGSAEVVTLVDGQLLRIRLASATSQNLKWEVVW